VFYFVFKFINLAYRNINITRKLRIPEEGKGLSENMTGRFVPVSDELSDREIIRCFVYVVGFIELYNTTD